MICQYVCGLLATSGAKHARFLASIFYPIGAINQFLPPGSQGTPVRLLYNVKGGQIRAIAGIRPCHKTDLMAAVIGFFHDGVAGNSGLIGIVVTGKFAD